MTQIVININPNGKVTTEVNGHAGSSCKELTRGIEKSLGVTTDDVKKPEFNRLAVNPNQQQQGAI